MSKGWLFSVMRRSTSWLHSKVWSTQFLECLLGLSPSPYGPGRRIKNLASSPQLTLPTTDKCHSTLVTLAQLFNALQALSSRINLEKNVEVYIDDAVIKCRLATSHPGDWRDAFNNHLGFGVRGGKLLCFLVAARNWSKPSKYMGDPRSRTTKDH